MLLLSFLAHLYSWEGLLSLERVSLWALEQRSESNMPR